MTEVPQFDTSEAKRKSFWKRPEGTTGLVFLIALIAGGGFLLINFLPAIIALISNVVYLSIMLLVLAAIIYMVLDPKMRNLVWYMYTRVSCARLRVDL